METRLSPGQVDIGKLHFAVCNLGPDLFDDEYPQESKENKDQCISFGTTSARPSPDSRYRNLPGLNFYKPVPLKRNDLGANKNISRDSISFLSQNKEEQNPKYGNINHLPLPKEKRGFALPGRHYRRNLAGQQVDEPNKREGSRVKVVSLNEQAKIQREGVFVEQQLEEISYRKFTEKYNHFKRMRNNAYSMLLGKFKSLEEIKNRANSLHFQSNRKVVGERDLDTSERISFSQREMQQMIRMRRKVIDGEIHGHKSYTDRSRKREVVYKEQNLPFLTQPHNSNEMKRYSSLCTTSSCLPTQEGPVYISVNELAGVCHINTLNPTSREVAQAAYIKTRGTKVRSKKVEKSKGVAQAGQRRFFSLYDNTMSHGYINTTYQEKVQSIEPISKETTPPRQMNTLKKKKDATKLYSRSMDTTLIAEDEKEYKSKSELTSEMPSPQLEAKKKAGTQSVIPELMKQMLMDKAKNTNKLTMLINKAVLLDPTTDLVGPGNRIGQQNRIKKERLNKRNMIEDLVNTKIEGWIHTSELKKRQKIKQK